MSWAKEMEQVLGKRHDPDLESLRQLAIDIAHALPHGDCCPEFSDYVDAILAELLDWRDAGTLMISEVAGEGR